MRVIIIPCLTTNYSFLVGAEGKREVAVVDPCEAHRISEVLREQSLELVAILNTHHHADHVGGNLALLSEFPGIPVYAHPSDAHRIPGITTTVDEGDELEVAGVHFRVMFIPGHTNGHIAYLTDGALFSGDTLFAGGCGRLFEGTPQMMNHSMNDKLARLPDDTRVYFAHEYTQTNLRFALDVEPSNLELQRRWQRVKAARERGEWTVPTTIGEEKLTNPFLRVTQPAVVAHFQGELPPNSNSDDVFAAVRRAKDRFR